MEILSTSGGNGGVLGLCKERFDSRLKDILKDRP
jgi:hypothetical protein